MSSSHRIQELLRATNHGNETRMELVDIHQIPCGVGAMAQVHEGTLIDHSKGTKERVAIKVLHPAVEERMATDLNFIKAFESFVSALVPGANHLNLKEEIVSFTEMMARQGSLRVEAANLKRFQGNFKDSSDLSIAFPSPRLFNEHVLVETFHTGISLQKLIQLKNSPFNEQVSKLGVKSLSVSLSV